MYARLNSKSAALPGKVYEIVAEAVIGHGPECNLLIKSGVLSAKHARIYFDQKKGSYFLEDFKSHNGTLLDGKPVQGKAKLEKKHVIMFANTFTFIFTVESGQASDPLPPPPKDLPVEPEAPPKRKSAESAAPGAAPPAEEPPAPPEPKAAAPVPQPAPQPAPHEDAFGLAEAPPKYAPAPEVAAEPEAALAPPPPAPEPVQEKAPAPQARDAAPTMLIDEAQLADLLSLPRFALEFKNVRGEKSSVNLKEGENTVGRLSTSDVAVDDASISRNHAIITVRAGKVALRDLGSKNGTYVADKKIASDTEVAPDTPIRFGLVKATILKRTGAPS
ncbi:MAG TPA: FHA domain-containing protein [Bacteroidota bacterium]|nr:FHA domain-containing protein [Bacteroidota bacterium]